MRIGSFGKEVYDDFAIRIYFLKNNLKKYFTINFKMKIKPLIDIEEQEIELLQQLRPHLKNSEICEKSFNKAKKSNIKFLAIYDKNLVMGIISYRIMFNLYLQEHLVIDDLVIDKKARGIGIGTKLINFVIGLAEEEKIKVIKLDSGIQRDKAHNFYEQLGWEKKCFTFEKIIDFA